MASTQARKWMNWFKYFQYNKDTNTAATPIGRGTNWFKYLQFNKDVDTAQDTRTILLTIFTLIAAATFQAAVNPPGGVWQEDLHSPNNATAIQQPPANPPEDHKAGSAIYSSWKIPYYVFLLSNTFAFSNSILVILSLTHKFPLRFEIRAATFSMAVTYGSAIFAISPHKCVKFRFVLIVSLLPFVIRFLISIYNFWYSNKSQSNKVVLPTTSDPIEVKIPSGSPPVARSSPVNRR